MSSSFGTLFRITTFGESHGPGIGGVIDGCPPGIPLEETDIQPQLDRRRPGQSTLTTSRNEPDRVRILSGVEDGKTLGTPLTLYMDNKDVRPADYREFSRVPRPSHADFTYRLKYGVQSKSGGGRAGARETAVRVAAGAVAEKILFSFFGTQIVAWVSAVGTVSWGTAEPERVTRAQVVQKARDKGDSLGGVITCVCRNVPGGLGEPVFDKMEARLAQAMLSVPACKGFEIGSGFAGTRMFGSKHNDAFIRRDGRLKTKTNFSGGVQGGITNGEPVYFRTAFKPTATIAIPQETVDVDGSPVTLKGAGRHDPCVVPRAVPIVESMAALVILDMAMMQRARGRG
ncbi:MAG: chorismate synthase [Deltaproteobacteria bacterium]|nr:chorismate synthase [Deltaproteobacteria bacterium]